MRTFLIHVLALALAGGCTRGEKPLTVDELEQDRDRYTGKVVKLAGYCTFSTEYEAPILLWNSREDAESNQVRNNVELYSMKGVGRVKKISPPFKAYVQVTGTVFLSEMEFPNVSIHDITSLEIKQ